MNKVTLSVSVLTLATGAALAATPAAANPSMPMPGWSFGHPPPIPGQIHGVPVIPRPPHHVHGVIVEPPGPILGVHGVMVWPDRPSMLNN
jgi:hypothetical protein